MKNIILVTVVILIIIYFTLIMNKGSQQSMPIVNKYPWQVSVLADGKTRVFGVIFNESTLGDVNKILNSTATIALFETKTTLVKNNLPANKLSLEAYYKNISLGGLIGSFIFTLNASGQQLKNFKRESRKHKVTENGSIRYELGMSRSDKIKMLAVKNLIYIPTVQLDEETIIKRFGKPKNKIKLNTKEKGWHYLYPEKGLDLIYKEEGKEVLQYVLPKEFNLLLEPLQSLQNPKR